MPNKRLEENIRKATTPTAPKFSSGMANTQIAGMGNAAAQSAYDQEYLAKRTKLNSALGKISSMLGLAVGVGDYISQSKQEKEAKGLMDKIQTPVFQPRRKSQELARELRDVDFRRLNPYGMVAPVQDQINIGYNQDLARAQMVSGGQASTAGILGQAAALRRDANLGTLAQAASGALSEQDARALQAANAIAEDNANRDYLNLYKFQIENARSMQEGEAVGEAISSSRLRKLQARNDAWTSLITSPVFDVNTYENMLRQGLTTRL